MSLRSYLEKAYEPEMEIRSAFRPEEIEQVFRQLQEIGFSKYFSFVKEHQADILKYIRLTPSQRQQKKWISHPQNLLLRLAALQISEATVELQTEIIEVADVVDRGSHRSFHSILAGGVCNLLLSCPFYYFPFEEYKSPFARK